MWAFAGQKHPTRTNSLVVSHIQCLPLSTKCADGACDWRIITPLPCKRTQGWTGRPWVSEPICSQLSDTRYPESQMHSLVEPVNPKEPDWVPLALSYWPHCFNSSNEAVPSQHLITYCISCMLQGTQVLAYITQATDAARSPNPVMPGMDFLINL